MSLTGSLTKKYGMFFSDLVDIAIWPYAKTITAFLDHDAKAEDLILGVGLCIFLSTVVPILPAIASITFAIAGFGMSLLLASMFLAYPITLIADAVIACDDHEDTASFSY